MLQPTKQCCNLPRTKGFVSIHEPVLCLLFAVSECGANQYIEFSGFSALPFTETELVPCLLQDPETIKVA